MEELDAQLATIVDKASGRNLLDPTDPKPLSINVGSGDTVRCSLQIQNGQQGLIDLAIASDQAWLRPETPHLTLVGGEMGECTIATNDKGVGELASLLFSWEGAERTLSRPVTIMRNVTGVRPDTASESDASSRPSAAAEQAHLQQAVKKVEKVIEGYGGPDKFVDYDEEQQIFRKGGEHELANAQVEAILHRMCSEGGWTRQTRLTEKLTALLNEATKDDGVIDKGEFEHVIGIAVRRKMPRLDAIAHCVTLVLDHRDRFKVKQGFMKGGPWFDDLKKQCGLI
jgi:hypothetical protein